MKNKFITQFEKWMCSMTVIIAMFAVGGCRTIFFQPEEPNGLKEFAKRD